MKEIGGTSYIYNRPFFDDIKQNTGMELENFVYFKNETHYFVMTAKKHCLLEKGILKEVRSIL